MICKNNTVWFLRQKQALQALNQPLPSYIPHCQPSQPITSQRQSQRHQNNQQIISIDKTFSPAPFSTRSSLQVSTQPSQKLVDRAGLPQLTTCAKPSPTTFPTTFRCSAVARFNTPSPHAAPCAATCSMSDESTATMLEQEELSNPVPIILGVVGTIVVLFFAGARCGVVWAFVEGPA